jgi:hypothetical protein
MQLSQATAGTAKVSLKGISKVRSTVAYQRHLVVALTVRRPVQLRFVAPDGAPVPTDRITQVSLSGGGSKLVLGPDQLHDQVMVVSGTSREVESVWKAAGVAYSVDSVKVDGSDAVFSGRQRFDAVKSGIWTIKLSVFDITITARDVLFGSTVKSSVLVTMPDGMDVEHTMTNGDALLLSDLVRGTYDLKISAALLGSRSTLLVSRNDAVELRVMTLRDAAVIGAALLLMAALLIWLGRAMRSSRQKRTEV